MDASEIQPTMRQRWEEVAEVLGISPSAATVLLQCYNWSKDRLMEAYTNDQDKFLMNAGVYHRCGKAITSNPAEKTCPICYDDVEGMMGMPCGHAFCLGCWYDFCITAIADGPEVVKKTCPHAGCKEVVTADEFERVLGATAKEFTRYQTFQLKSFVESDELSRWCPGPGCERVACAETISDKEEKGSSLRCDTCFTSFCLMCGNEPHAPVSCRDLALWLKKCQDESETSNWILANTKECAKCGVRIEKNQGCHHMTCRRCGYEFCWLCMADWNKHGYNYTCNRYDEKSPDSEKARASLNRYLHFYQRFHGHADGETFAKKQISETEQRMLTLQDSSATARWADVEFLKKANVLLVECRRVLKYTYVFGYYMNEQSQVLQRERFEYHQEKLEAFTEGLSELMEKPVEEIDRTEAVNKIGVVETYMKNILKYVDEGMES